jgi:exosortase/archaeosortase family protein
VVSLAAGYLFLRAPWKRALFTLMVVPLGILRNGVRIVTIGELCTHYGPQMIHSYLHRKGGWIFFLVSLGPLLALLWVLARSDQPPAKSTRPIEGSP